MKCEMKEEQGCYNCPAYDTAYCPEDKPTLLYSIITIIALLFMSVVLVALIFILL